MEIIKEDFEKEESVYTEFVDYYGKNEEGEWDVFYKKFDIKTVIYMNKSIVAELDELDYDLHYDYSLDGLVREYYEDGTMKEMNISEHIIHQGAVSHVTKRDIGYINKYICRDSLLRNIKTIDDKEPICNLEKIELFWTEMDDLEICEYECSICNHLVELRSDEISCCQSCCCDSCPDCLIENEYVEMLVCPQCNEEINQEYNEDNN